MFNYYKTDYSIEDPNEIKKAPDWILQYQKEICKTVIHFKADCSINIYQKSTDHNTSHQSSSSSSSAAASSPGSSHSNPSSKQVKPVFVLFAGGDYIHWDVDHPSYLPFIHKLVTRHDVIVCCPKLHAFDVKPIILQQAIPLILTISAISLFIVVYALSGNASRQQKTKHYIFASILFAITVGIMILCCLSLEDSGAVRASMEQIFQDGAESIQWIQDHVLCHESEKNNRFPSSHFDESKNASKIMGIGDKYRFHGIGYCSGGILLQSILQQEELSIRTTCDLRSVFKSIVLVSGVFDRVIPNFYTYMYHYWEHKNCKTLPMRNLSKTPFVSTLFVLPELDYSFLYVGVRHFREALRARYQEAFNVNHKRDKPHPNKLKSEAMAFYPSVTIENGRHDFIIDHHAQEQFLYYVQQFCHLSH